MYFEEILIQSKADEILKKKLKPIIIKTKNKALKSVGLLSIMSK